MANIEGEALKETLNILADEVGFRHEAAHVRFDELVGNERYIPGAAEAAEVDSLRAEVAALRASLGQGPAQPAVAEVAQVGPDVAELQRQLAESEAARANAEARAAMSAGAAGFTGEAAPESTGGDGGTS